MAGEKSGEEHCMSFFRELKAGLPDFKFWGVGGDELKNEGMELIEHLKNFSSWGVSEVIGKIPFYINKRKEILAEVEKRQTKYALLIDFQTFNLSLAPKLTEKGVKVFYLVAPQAWAWKEWRTRPLSKNVDTLFTIIPFEKKWFMDRGVRQALSVPHPLKLKWGSSLNKRALGLEHKPFIQLEKEVHLLVLPGSRRFEISELLPVFMRTIQSLKKEFNIKVGLVQSSNIDESIFSSYQEMIDSNFSNDQLEDALEWAHVSFAASGTVTLALGLFQIPTIVAYRSSLLNQFIFETFVNYQGPISLTNIIHEDDVFPEFIQDRCSEYNLEMAMRRWLEDRDQYEKTLGQLVSTNDLLTGEITDLGLYLAEQIGDGKC